ncbi:MAG: DinB family protein [Alphaproteobacteria bacterium]
MTKSLADHFQLLARYNTGANERLDGACTKLTDADRKADRKGFFHCIHGTLNHLLVGDRVWMARFEDGTSPSTGLDALLYEEFDALRTARIAEDERITTFVESLDDDHIAGSIVYISNEGRRLEDPTHFFNHETHHRGQVHDMLSQTGVETPVLDMHRVIDP